MGTPDPARSIPRPTLSGRDRRRAVRCGLTECPPRSSGSQGVRRARIFVVVVVWAAVLIGWTWYRRSADLGAVDAAQQFVDAARGSWWAVFAFLLASVLRPFLLLPGTVLTVAIGLVFGPMLGIVVAVVGANAAALVGYVVGGAFSRADVGDGRIAAWSARLRERSFETVLVMRLMFLPYDPVNYAAGYFRISWWPFLAATAIGSLPGTVSFVLLGASLTDLTEGIGGIDPVTLAISIALIIGGLVTARLVRQRTGAEVLDR